MFTMTGQSLCSVTGFTLLIIFEYYIITSKYFQKSFRNIENTEEQRSVGLVHHYLIGILFLSRTLKRAKDTSIRTNDEILAIECPTKFILRPYYVWS